MQVLTSHHYQPSPTKGGGGLLLHRKWLEKRIPKIVNATVCRLFTVASQQAKATVTV